MPFVRSGVAAMSSKSVTDARSVRALRNTVFGLGRIP